MLTGTAARQLPRVPKMPLSVPKETQTCSSGQKKTSWFCFGVPGIMESPQRLELPPLPEDLGQNLEIWCNWGTPAFHDGGPPEQEPRTQHLTPGGDLRSKKLGAGDSVQVWTSKVSHIHA